MLQASHAPWQCAKLRVESNRGLELHWSSRYAISILADSSGLKIKPNEDAFGIRKIADDFLDWRRKPAYQCGNGDDLVASGQLRAAQQIDDLDAVSPTHVGLADLFQIAERRDGIGRVAGNVEAEFPGDDF